MKTKKIRNLFIANRGEISRRIAVSAKRMGISCVTYRDSLGQPQYLNDLIANWITKENLNTQDYLDGDQLIADAKAADCDAIHAGFGFLSENSDFAQKVLNAGLIWVGPSPKAMQVMASKSNAAEIAIKAKVPTIPGIRGFFPPESVDGDFKALEDFAGQAGFPILLKAALGGGGKGMRLVHSTEQLKDAAILAGSEAKSSFGDAELICERYLEHARHIEVQVLGDTEGNIWILGDRDCSVQRRHQKIIEEAPAPAIPSSIREAMHQSALSLAKEVGYFSAGTVEFLLEWDPVKQKGEKFFFLEMNTRLQVEHPVTEEIYGVDLVEWQLRIAGGEALPQNPPTPHGHAIEVRIYAEDTGNNFFPAPGPVDLFWPAPRQELRWEKGMDTVDQVDPSFDPMVAKLVSHAKTRSEAIQQIATGLQGTHLVNAANNIHYLQAILQDSDFCQKAVSTHFIENKHEALIAKIEKEEVFLSNNVDEIGYTLHKLTTGLGKTQRDVAITIKAQTQSLFQKQRSLYVEQSCSWIQLESGRILRTGFAKVGNQNPLPVETAAFLTEKGTLYHVQTPLASRVWFERPLELQSLQDEAQFSGQLRATVPGKVVEVFGSPGTQVAQDEVVLVLESMKMQFEVRSTVAGTIATIEVEKGSQVESGQCLVTFEADSSDSQ